jgi:hypothetical protein
MIIDKPMSFEERVKTSVQAIKLREQGKVKEAEALKKTVPILAEQAWVIKKYFGLDALRSLDLNLSNAVVKYGPDFLTK